MNKNKTRRGITLIALVITIIVMLILVGVTVSIAINGGLFGTAKDAARKTQIAEIKELVQTDITVEQVNNNEEITRKELKQILDKYFKDVPEELPYELEEIVLTAKEEYGGYANISLLDIYDGFIADEEGILKAEDIAKKPETYFGKTVIGYECEKQDACDWLLFYANETNIYLIASDYISYNDMPLKNEKALNKGDTEYEAYFTNILSEYEGSVNITDSKIQNLNSDYFIKNYESSNNNMKAVAYMLDTEIWNIYAGKKAEYAIGGPTIELLFKSYNAKYKTDYEAQASSNRGYQIRKDKDSSWVDSSNGFLNEGDNLYSINNEYWMWIASPSNNTNSTSEIGPYVMVDKKGHVGNVWYSTKNAGFRPIVCLKSTTRLEEQTNDTLEIKK